MTHVVCQPCDNCKYTDCVVVCPVDCFYEGETMLYIHPDECIDCEACIPECPVEAIFRDENVPEEWRNYIQINADMAPQCPVITEKKEPLAENYLRGRGRPFAAGTPATARLAANAWRKSVSPRSYGATPTGSKLNNLTGRASSCCKMQRSSGVETRDAG